MNAESFSDLHKIIGEDFWLASWCNSTAIEGYYLFSCFSFIKFPFAVLLSLSCNGMLWVSRISNIDPIWSCFPVEAPRKNKNHPAKIVRYKVLPMLNWLLLLTHLLIGCFFVFFILTGTKMDLTLQLELLVHLLGGRTLKWKWHKHGSYVFMWKWLLGYCIGTFHNFF